MNELMIKSLQKLIFDYSGISITGAHLEFLKRYIKNRLLETNLSIDSFFKTLLLRDLEFELLINSITINETFFFREEKQFLYLLNEFLPTKKDSKLRIWSAACSTGEEVYSLAALCKQYNIDAKIYASDINTASLLRLRKAEYYNTSFREDGKSLKPLLDQYTICNEKSIIISDELKKLVKEFPFNLFLFDGCKECLGEESFDIIFVRNVFIYFSEDTKQACLEFLTKKLNPGGLLFTSTSEIASIEVPFCSKLKKQKKAGIFFFRKEEEMLC